MRCLLTMSRLLLAVLPTTFSATTAVAAEPPEKPNILLILADDLGWSDLGCYGSEIRTPNLDALAAGGVRFTQFYNSARCSPSRVAILTGLHPHQAGFPNLSGVIAESAVTIPEALKPAGYKSYMVGKWHLSKITTPTVRGFDEFYGMLGGFNSCWQENPYYTRLPEGRDKRSYAPGEFYATDAFADYSVDFLNDAKAAGKPWFFYLAFNAPHFPLHAWEQDIARYEETYAQGWDKIRAQRLAKQKELGLVPANLKLTPRSNIPANLFNDKTGWAGKDNPAWDSLPADRRADLARRQAVFAAMVDRMDLAVGRVIDALKKNGQYENTVIFFLSDNGACAEWDPYGFDQSSGPNNILHTGQDLKKVGGPDSYISYGSGWANVGNTPWRLYKHYGHEGGIRTPMIVHWPAGLKAKAGSLANDPGYITDFMPTVLNLTSASYPKQHAGNAILPHEGVSLRPVIDGEELPERQIFIEHEGNKAVRAGKWKLVALHDKPWELYDLSADPTEMNDQASNAPDRVAAMAKAWDQWAERCMVKQPRGGQPRAVVTPSPQIANKPLTISFDVDPKSKDGVMVAQGGRQHGYAVRLSEGKLVFDVRVNEKITSIIASETPSGTMSVVAKLKAGGAMELAINGKVVATGKAGGLIPVQPVDALSIGQDTQSAVGEYQGPNTLKGKVTNVKVVGE